MPELPEVETIRTQLEPLLVARMITDGGSNPSAKFASAVEAVGAELVDVRRRGKYLIIGLDTATHQWDTQSDGPDVAEWPAPDGRTDAECPHPDRGAAAEWPQPGTRAGPGELPAKREPAEELVVHLGMTGRLAVRPDADLKHPHLRAWWRLDGGEVLTFHDVRRFGRIHVAPAGDYEALPTLSRLGPEPFSEEFDGNSLWRALRLSSRCVKTQLLSQRPVAGVGNIYADEALWLASINPAVRRLSKARCEVLAEAIRDALASGLRHRGTTLRDYVSVDGSTGANQHHLHCYGRAGEPCERCGTELHRRVIDARGTTFCPSCQRR